MYHTVIIIIISWLSLSFFQGMLVFDGATERSWRVVHATMYPHPDFSTYRVRLREFYVKRFFPHFLNYDRSITITRKRLAVCYERPSYAHFFDLQTTKDRGEHISLKFYCGWILRLRGFWFFPMNIYAFGSSSVIAQRDFSFLHVRAIILSRKSPEEFHGEVTVSP